MLKKFKKSIEIDFSFIENKNLLIAVSGGVDSVVLTHILHQLDYNISLAHCNFNLRVAESNADEEFVKKLGKRLNLEVFTTHFKTETFAKINRQSIQIAARNLRYAWFEELTKKHNFNYVLTAHHTDDNLETFLINLIRGTGLDGFTGIPAVNKNIIRTLLSFSREDIVSFAKENNIEWREDKSNASTKYIRNKIRHQIIPVLKEFNPDLLDSFLKTTEHLQGSQQIINDCVSKVEDTVLSKRENGIIKIDISKLKCFKNPKAYLYEILKNYSFTEWDNVAHLLDAQSGKQVFSATHRLLKDRNFLLLTEINLTSKEGQEHFLIENTTSENTNPIHLKFDIVAEKSIENNQTIYLDKDALTFPLIIRKWQKGDFFYPSGMKGKKKLSKYFKDEKYSLLDKENAWLLCSENKIIWVINRRQDSRFLISSGVKNILKISCLKLSSLNIFS